MVYWYDYVDSNSQICLLNYHHKSTLFEISGFVLDKKYLEINASKLNIFLVHISFVGHVNMGIGHPSKQINWKLFSSSTIPKIVNCDTSAYVAMVVVLSCIFLYLRGRRWCHGDSRDLNCLQFGEEEEGAAAAAVGGYPQILLLGRGSTFCRNFIQFGHHERRSSGNRSWTAWEWVVGRPPPFNGTTHKPIKKPYR